MTKEYELDEIPTTGKNLWGGGIPFFVTFELIITVQSILFIFQLIIEK